METLALLDGATPIGVIVFALPPRETFVRYGVSEAWELARLFIEDVTPKNTETWFIARAIRWIQKNRPSVQLLVSYADPSVNHQGVIYRAGNWIVDGRTDQERKTPRFDYEALEQIPEAPLLTQAVHAKKFSRKSHVNGAEVKRVPRASKYRFVYWLDGTHEKRRAHSLAAPPECPAQAPTLASGPATGANRGNRPDAESNVPSEP